jgi:hypothetical protein
MAFRIQMHRLEATPNAHFVTGLLDQESVRFAIARDASERLGWNPCLEEALRRLQTGERDFMVNYGVPYLAREPLPAPASDPGFAQP